MAAEVSSGFDYFNGIILPLLIFISRLFDVTLATMRQIFMNRGFKKIVPIVGFFEVLIWLIAMTQIVNKMDNVFYYLAWAGGFSVGTYTGMLLEERLALGLQVIRIITNQECEELIRVMKEKNHGVTIVPAQGAKGPVKMIFSIVKRGHVDSIVKLIRQYNPTAFYSVEDIRDTRQGVFQQAPKNSFIRRLAPGGRK